jgi:hypothetical protein
MTTPNELLDIFNIVLPALLNTAEPLTSSQKEELSRTAMKMAKAAKNEKDSVDKIYGIDVSVGPSFTNGLSGRPYAPNTGWFTPIVGVESVMNSSGVTITSPTTGTIGKGDAAAFINKAGKTFKTKSPGRPATLYTPAEVGKLLGVSRRAVLWLIDTKQLVARSKGTGTSVRHLITKTALKTFLNTKEGKERFKGVKV